MRLLPLDDKDTVLFNSHVNRTLYTVYRDNTHSFTLMWEQQGTGYWLKFCISLRSVLQKQGFSIQLSAFNLNHFEEFSINLTKLLTGKSAEAVHTYVKDVVSISRFHQLLNNIPNAFMSKGTKLTPAFERLFGSPLVPGNIRKMFGTLALHLRAVGSLLRLLERWLTAVTVSTSDTSWWHPPESWHYGNQLQASYFEVFLKKTWNGQLLSLLSVRSRDICWWNALPQGERVTKVQQRHSSLGCFIAEMCSNFDISLSDCIGIMEDEIFYHQVVSSCPRGKFRIFSTYSVTVMFVRALCRGLYLADSMSAFHPFSQVIISFSNAAFSHEFWYGAKGMQTQLCIWEEKQHSAYHPSGVMYFKDQVNYLFRVIGGHLFRARMAVTLNSNFYDTLYGGVTWTSPVTLVRLPWNISLFTNWLEVLLIEIYKFECYFIPLCHFPLSSNVVSLVECIYRKVSEVKFLVKTCILIADGILKRKEREASACHEPRKLLYTAIPRLNHFMKFLQRDAYRILDVMLKAGWNKEEREDGESCPLVTGRIKTDLVTWNSVPDIDDYYSKNFRHINYWISNTEWPGIGGGEEFFTEAVEMLQNYKPGCKTPVEMKYPYKFSLFMECAHSGHLNFTNESDKPTQRLLLFITSILTMLEEDGWLSPLALKEICAHFGENELHQLHKRLNSKSHVEPDERVKRLEQIVNFGAVYYVVACLLGDTWHCKIAGQNALAQLQRNETFAIMADAGARLSVLTQLVVGIVECPPAKYFQDAETEIQKHSKDSHLSIEEAVLLLESFEKEASMKINVSTAEALTAVKVPLLEEMQRPSVGTDWLKYLEKKRMQLLQLVSNEQFRVTGSYVKCNYPAPVELFPLYDVLEHRLVEEMAAMQKCLELGGLFYGPTYGLCRLLAHRFTWIQQSFIKWKKGRHELQREAPPLDNSYLHCAASSYRIRMVAALIPLQALFFTYISKYRTTHPISEMTIEMFFEWTDIARLQSTYDMWNSLGNCLTDYILAVKHMGCEYIEKMLEHCNEVWVVAPFCSNAEECAEFGSIKHAQQIVTTFTQLFLMCYHSILIQTPRFTTLDLTEKMEASLVNVTVILRQVELDEAVIPQTWPRARQTLKKELRAIWGFLLEMRKIMDTSVFTRQPIRGHSNSTDVWKDFFTTFVSSQYRNILQRIAFSEFINTRDPESESASSIKVQNESAMKTNKSKAETKHVSPTRVPDKSDVILNGLSSSKTNSCAASKSNDPEKSVGSRNITEERSQQNVHSEENEKQQNSEAVKQNTHSGPEAPNKCKVCTYCKSVEPERRTYKKCSLCKKERWHQPRFYCSKECQEKDWRTKHNMEHKCGEVLQ